jgi:hypothetical protein
LEIRYDGQTVHLSAEEIMRAVKILQGLASTPEVKCHQNFRAAYPLPCNDFTDASAGVSPMPPG